MALASDDECIHLIFPATACTLCNGKDAQRVKEDVWSEPFNARYPGGCPCGRPIRLGDSIVLHRPTKRPYHEGCEQ